ncbi:MAG TPA: CBS domain-containing protein [Spirochaetota bacterium]|jgi:tRNA nucleotidyltransferase (CCA-adding enzyme)|nr:MAG: Hypoxic response protein 1 [Spirochaetes bacterium ADurb.Bin218]HOK03289.1 CBS domain-containing protein [Spirochaetota bacterium]HOK91567.1 CBS domain-containing protein [Spirochaetota bacterium]HPP96180.1 CBS domain-containing protein [Spirochaetota bacterium]HRU64193.1 CBS domain-containing protein [Spirochaetota bacterium]
MKIIVGHTNMDLDCIGSMVLARYLHPDFVPVMSNLIHPSARNLYNLYQYHLGFVHSDELKKENITDVVIVDTRSFSRVKEYFDLFDSSQTKIEIYDHHIAEESDFPEAIIHQGSYGSNTTMLGLKLMENNIAISDKDATIALTAVFSDTGNFTHDNVSDSDFAVASYFLKFGADIKLVNNFIKSFREEYQLSLFHEIMNTLVWQNIKGHQIIFSYYAMEKQAAGLAAVIEEIFNIENPDAIFGVFHFEKPQSTVIIGRSRKNNIDLIEILKPFGGGGHPKAASALVKKEEGREVFRRLLEFLTLNLEKAITAKDIMTSNVVTINENWSLLEASVFFEEKNISGAPVVNDKGDLVGMLTLRDIMNGRKKNQMSLPVKANMKTKLITCSPDITMREIENILFANGIGHLPVMEDGKMSGIITRSDLLRFLQMI